MGWATGQSNPHLLAAAVAHPTPAPAAPRGPSSPEAQRLLPVRMDTSEVLHLEHKDEPHEGDGRTRNCMALLRRVRLHRVASAAPTHLCNILMGQSGPNPIQAWAGGTVA